MAYRLEALKEQVSQRQPRIISYDSGYEHSIEHLVELRMMVETAESEEEKDLSDRSRAMAAYG